MVCFPLPWVFPPPPCFSLKTNPWFIEVSWLRDRGGGLNVTNVRACQRRLGKCNCKGKCWGWGFGQIAQVWRRFLCIFFWLSSSRETETSHRFWMYAMFFALMFGAELCADFCTAFVAYFVRRLVHRLLMHTAQIVAQLFVPMFWRFFFNALAPVNNVF